MLALFTAAAVKADASAAAVTAADAVTAAVAASTLSCEFECGFTTVFDT
jgi:hypothetical protein